MEKKIETSSDAKPSEATNVYWLFAMRNKGKYPRPTENCGKWLVFVNEKDVDEIWAKIKTATEEGKIAPRLWPLCETGGKAAEECELWEG